MAAPAPPGVPRRGNSPHSGPPFLNYNPSLETTAELSHNFKNLNVNQPSRAIPPGPARPSLTGQASPFQDASPPASFPGPSIVWGPTAPPPGIVARATIAPIRPPQNASPSPLTNLASGRPSPAPFSYQTPPSASRLPQGSSPISAPVAFSSPYSGLQAASLPSSGRPNGIGSPSPSIGPVANAPPFATPRPISNVSPPFPTGAPRFPPYGGLQQPNGPPPSTANFRTPPQASIMPSFPEDESRTSSGTVSQVSSLNPAAPFSAAPQFVPARASPFGSQPWRTQQHQAPPLSVPGSGATSGMYVTSSSLPQAIGTMPSISQIGTVDGSNKMDPKQVPRPVPSSSIILHETRQNNQANPPPPATSTYIVQDTGNCSPRYMRCTINQIPCTSDLLGSTGIQLALLVQPFALPHPSEEPIQIVDFGESGPVRCSCCKGYINPFMKFIDQGRRFICNFCGYTDDTPHDYQCNLGPDGRRRDADERPELCRGTVEFVAPKEYMVRDPMPAVFFFLVDVSMNAIQTGATAAACSAINQVIGDLPEGPRTMVGIATFDSTIHFYNLKRALQQPLMLIVPDIQDVYTPLESDVIVPLSECRQHLELLLESIPTMYQNSKTADSAFGAAIKAAFLAMKKFGGKLLVFQSVLPTVGICALSAREAEGRANIAAGEKEANNLLQPQDNTLKEMAIELAEYQVCVDVFLTTQSYVDIASISVLPRTTGGQVYYYFPYSAVSDTAKLYNDLRWNVTRPQGFEAVMRVRCSQGLQVQEYLGNFCKRIPTDIDMPGIDSDKTIMVTLMIDEKLQDGSECSFQCALLYTTVYGQRRIRVSTLSLPCTSNFSNIFRGADVDAQLVCYLKQAAIEIPRAPLMQVREQVKNKCINILHSYRKFCALGSSSGQLALSEELKYLPLYTLALMKSTGLRTDGRIDNCSAWISYVSSVSAPLAIPLVYPRMISVHDLESKEIDESTLAFSVPLSSEHVSDGGIYLLENGMDALLYVGSSVDPHIVQQIFGTSAVDKIPNQLVLQQFDNPLSRKLNEVINEIRRQRCSYLSLKLCKKGDPSGTAFFSYLVEDKTPMSLSYVEFLVYIHRQINSKMS